MSESQISILQDRQGCLVLVSKSSNNVRVVIENLLQRILKIIIIRINVNKKYSYVKQKSNIRTDQIHTTIGTQLDFDIFWLRYLFNPMYSNEILRHLVWFFNIPKCKFSLSYSKLQNRTNFRMGYIQEGGLNISTNTMIFPESICILANRPLVTSLCMFDKVYLLLFKVNYPTKVI